MVTDSSTQEFLMGAKLTHRLAAVTKQRVRCYLGMEVDSSLFAVFRMVVIMLWRDGTLHWREQRWFKRLMRHHELSQEQIQILYSDLKRPAQVADIYPQITQPEDREKLMGWLRMAMGVDGECSAGERAFYQEVLAIHETPTAQNEHYLGFAIEIKKHQQRIQFWQRMTKLGRFLNRRVNRYWWFW